MPVETVKIDFLGVYSIHKGLFDMARKPFTPEEVRSIVERLKEPAVFHNMTADWPALHWTAQHLSRCMGKEAVLFRIGKRKTHQTPLFETQCAYVEATLGEFLSWAGGESGPSIGPFSDYPLFDFWAYADYKYIAKLFHHKEAMFKEVVWSDFGYPGRNGAASTLWVGAEGANTPCHLDTYGFNLVFQVQGRKRWHLFPPEDTSFMYPTRIPYEESSIFSQVNVPQPDLDRFPAFRRARAHVVTLQPGQVLLVPRHWWHYVESVDSVTVSINSWIELEEDSEARVGEALTKTLVCALKTTPSHSNNDNWLNPTEDSVASHDENMQYLSLAVQACVDKSRTGDSDQGQDGCRSLKRDSSGVIKANSNQKEEKKNPCFSPPFGPHLVPVPFAGPSHVIKDICPKDNSLSRDRNPPCSLHLDSQSRTAGVASDPTERDLHRRQEASGLFEHPQEEGLPQASLCTSDLLECLVHPDVMALVSQLLLDRQRELASSVTAKQSQGVVI
ncbi:HSPB1-associated protein 1 homolog isoform X1 [Alosa sapidissima]|uniref:HSPB1-associated protein 1 homolog isoform X1 n=2 Tax=Alosa sapidissima TaxID=34773 RepID=UPI001C099118|nr:HSPB1-associated protein 1 homolog isoform X1 [Alosa sapidissima]